MSLSLRIFFRGGFYHTHSVPHSLLLRTLVQILASFFRTRFPRERGIPGNISSKLTKSTFQGEILQLKIHCGWERLNWWALVQLWTKFSWKLTGTRRAEQRSCFHSQAGDLFPSLSPPLRSTLVFLFKLPRPRGFSKLPLAILMWISSPATHLA